MFIRFFPKVPSMPSKKRRFGLFDDLFDSFFSDFEEMFNGISRGGYSISVYTTPEGTIVEATVSDDVDVKEFRKSLEAKYPNAKIIIKGGKQSKKIERIDEKPEKKVTITLSDNKEENVKEEKEHQQKTPSILDLMYGKKKVFIEKED